MADVDEAGMAETARLVEGQGAGAVAHRIDLSDIAALERWLSELGDYDVLFNNAGVVSGEPLADFTYLLMNWVNGTISALPDLKAHGIPTLDEAVEIYCERTGRSGIHDLDWFFAYNMFRLAGICQGIVGRVRDGTANHPQAAAMAERVPLLADSAWKYAQKAGA